MGLNRCIRWMNWFVWAHATLETWFGKTRTNQLTHIEQSTCLLNPENDLINRIAQRIHLFLYVSESTRLIQKSVSNKTPRYLLIFFVYFSTLTLLLFWSLSAVQQLARIPWPQINILGMKSNFRINQVLDCPRWKS